MEKVNRQYLAGRWVSSNSCRLSPLIDPNTERQTAELVCGNAMDVDHAVRTAHKAFEDNWRSSSISGRLLVLEELIAQIRHRRDEFGEVISTEIGAPIDFALSQQVDTALSHLSATRNAASVLTSDHPISVDHPDHRIRYEPLGVAGLITPWNWPLNQVVLKVGAAIAAGCSMVLKPSELSTRTAVLFAECLSETSLPDGVFNLVTGDGETGSALAAHRDVAVVSFTGSTTAGRNVASLAAEGVKRTTLELGGKSPNLIFSDCDLERAMTQGVAHCFRNAGQSCNAASRMIVQREIYEDAVRLATQLIASFPVGDPASAGPHIGPLISEKQFERVQNYIQTGIADGARLIAGGPGRHPDFEHGYFARPTAFADVTPQMTIFQEEVFGPVLSMTPFDSEEEALNLGNASSYGLAAYIQTNDLARADRLACELRAGMIQVNGCSRAEGAPFGGVRSSGYGREAGAWGIREFQAVKSISGARSLDIR